MRWLLVVLAMSSGAVARAEELTVHGANTPPTQNIQSTPSPVRQAPDTYAYVSMAPEQKIQIYRLDPATGQLAPVDSISVAGAPGSLAVNPRRQVLFASLRSNSRVASYRIDPASGRLTAISEAALPDGENAAFVTTDHSGRWLLSASYLAGTVVVHRVRDDGTIESPAVQSVTTVRTAHCVAIDGKNDWVFVPHVTPNAIFQFRFDAATGALSKAGQAGGGTATAGPRHLAFHPSRKMAYTSDEQGVSVTAYRVDAEAGLTALQTVSTLPADDSGKGKNSTAEIKVHPSGRFLWVSNRGHDSLAGFSIDPATDKLTALGQTPTEKTPRSFDIDPSGQFACSAGEGSGKLAVFRIDTSTGHLERIQTLEVGKSLTWVTLVSVDRSQTRE